MLLKFKVVLKFGVVVVEVKVKIIDKVKVLPMLLVDIKVRVMIKVLLSGSGFSQNSFIDYYFVSFLNLDIPVVFADKCNHSKPNNVKILN